jgi:tetratricopeptide (TPR) repeat protein
MENLLLALHLFEEIEDKANTAETYESIGEAYSAMGNYAASITWLNDGLKAATEISEKRIAEESYAALANVYEKLKDYKRAYQYYRQYITSRDSLDNEEKAEKQTRLEMNYEFEKKEAVTKAEQDKKDALVAAETKRQTLIRNSILGGITVAGIFSFLLVRSFNRRRKTSFEKQVTEVEMKALRSQMNPHFIFNSLRSINEYIQHHKTTLASEYLIKFSKLMRAILENSRQKEILLSKEIEVLELYMQLESQRMEHPFSYTIEIDPEIDPENTLIPPMLLQPLVENSIRHGLAPKEKPGKISIRIKKQNETIQCEVEDDGIGREVLHSVNNKETKTESYGLKITAERLAIIEQIKKIKTNLTFRDLDGGDNFTGLNVTFALPFEEAV